MLLCSMSSVVAIAEEKTTFATGSRRTVTSLRHGAERLSWSPDGRSIAFEAPMWPNEVPFEVMDAQTHEQWMAAGRTAVKTTESIICKYDDTCGMLPPSVRQIGLVSLDDGVQQIISDPAVPGIRPVWSPDGRYVAWYGFANKGTTATRANIYLYDLQKKEIHCVLKDHPVSYSANLCFTRDGSGIIFSAYDHEGGSAEILYRIALEGGAPDP